MGRRVYRSAFHALARLGAPIGGLRPRRLYHWLARAGYGDAAPAETEFRWCRDRWGYRFRLHPHYLIDRSIIAFGGYDVDLLGFLHARLAPGMVCLDVGANLGQVTVHMAGLVAPGGRVHSFEPLPHVRRRLALHVESNGLAGIVAVHGIALSDATGSATFHYADAGGDNQGMGSLVGHDHPGLGLACTVPTMRLDDFAARHGIERIDWIKIDIQGAEPLFLAGARETLLRHGPELLVEVAPTDLGRLGRTSRDLLRALGEIGYRAFELRRGAVGRELGSDVPPDYTADNVYCTRAPSA